MKQAETTRRRGNGAAPVFVGEGEDEEIGYIRNSLRIPLLYYGIAAAIYILLKKITKKHSPGLLFAYCFLVYATTVLARTTRELAELNLTPLRVLQHEGWAWQKEYLQQVTANILMFVPIGFLFMRMGKGIRRNWAKILNVVLSLAVGFLFSVFVEASQYYLRRGLCETDDVIHNTIGVVVGMIVHVVLSKVGSKL